MPDQPNLDAQPKLHVERQCFTSLHDAMADITAQGLWPTTYISSPSPELPVHWHDTDMQGYLVRGETYILDGDGKRVNLSAGDKLVLPAGSLHAEGLVTADDDIVYVVGLAHCRPFAHALQLLNPATWPTPDLLPLKAAFAAEMFEALKAAAPKPPPVV